ncbi:MAG: hypothetical protein KA155_08005 [Alphaproteobacteria bacterium]|nr:hypothetical protein [Alphaproteobacteria bacterium]
MPTPKYKPTTEKRHMVQVLSAAGTPKRTIARALKIGQDTLSKYYAEDLENGLELANARVVNRLFQLIMQGSTPATIFWLKARAGWKEGQVIEVKNKQGSEINVAALSDVERKKLRELLSKATHAAKPQVH